MAKPSVSVLMPVYNAEKTLAKAAISTLRAMNDNSELLMFNDASTDSSARIMSELASSDSRVRIFNSAKNLGVAEALNVLIAEARFDYIARMDSDDICLPWRFRKLDRKLANTDFYFTSAILLRGRFVKFSFQIPLTLTNVELLEILKFKNPLVHSTMICLKHKLIKLGGYKKVAAEDWDLWMRALIAGFSIKRFWMPALILRLHSGQLTQTKEWQSWQTDDGNMESTNQLRAMAPPLPQIEPLSLSRLKISLFLRGQTKGNV